MSRQMPGRQHEGITRGRGSSSAAYCTVLFQCADNATNSLRPSARRRMLHFEQAMSDMDELSARSSVTTHIFGLNLLK